MSREQDIARMLFEELENKVVALLTKLLPVFDKVEETCRGIVEKPDDQLSDLVRSLAFLPDVLDEATASIELNRFGKPGEVVDRLRHEIKHVSQSEQPAGTILRVFQHGWEFDGQILRRAAVGVSGDASETHQPADADLRKNELKHIFSQIIR